MLTKENKEPEILLEREEVILDKRVPEDPPSNVEGAAPEKLVVKIKVKKQTDHSLPGKKLKTGCVLVDYSSDESEERGEPEAKPSAE